MSSTQFNKCTIYYPGTTWLIWSVPAFWPENFIEVRQKNSSQSSAKFAVGFSAGSCIIYYRYNQNYLSRMAQKISDSARNWVGACMYLKDYFPKTTSSNTITSFVSPEFFLLCNREGMVPEASFPDHVKSHTHCLFSSYTKCCSSLL